MPKAYTSPASDPKKLTTPQEITFCPNFAPIALASRFVWDGVGAMTAVLNEIRNLDGRLNRGEITPAEYDRERVKLLHSIEDAQSDFIDITPVVEAREMPRQGSSALGLGLVVCLLVMSLCISLTLLFLPDLNLALTLGVTILAALSVALLQTKDD